MNALWAALSVLLLAGTACAGYGNVGTVSKTVDAAGARSARASFVIADGQLDISGGADPLMHASFTTNDKRTPDVKYLVQNGTGTITVTQSSKPSGASIGPATNHWAVNLNDDIPIDLDVNAQSAHTQLNLDTLTVKTLALSTSSGAATIGLNGDQTQLSAVSLRTASGDIHLSMDGDYRAPASLEVDSSSGAVTADLSGKWAGPLSGTFTSASGPITITVPKNFGVQVTTSTDAGHVDAEGFSDRGQGVYVSGSTTAFVVRLVIRTSSGDITLRHAG